VNHVEPSSSVANTCRLPLAARSASIPRIVRPCGASANRRRPAIRLPGSPPFQPLSLGRCQVSQMVPRAGPTTNTLKTPESATADVTISTSSIAGGCSGPGAPPVAGIPAWTQARRSGPGQAVAKCAPCQVLVSVRPVTEHSQS
jgi:hypothetical protein